MTRYLVIASGLAIVLVLVMTAAAVYYSSQVSKVPRTAVERDFIVAKQAATQKPKDAKAWAMYASAAIDAGKYDDASAAIKHLQTMTQRSIVLLLQGDLAQAKGDLSAARTDYEKAVAQAKKDYEKDVTESGVNPKAMGPSESEIQAYTALGALDMRMKDYKAAIQDFGEALRLDPNASDSLTLLGDAQAAIGDKKSAEASYDKALQFVPDYAPALKGLKALKGGE